MNDEVDFEIHGSEMQFVEVELDPGESAIAEAGAMMDKDTYWKMKTERTYQSPSLSSVIFVL